MPAVAARAPGNFAVLGAVLAVSFAAIACGCPRAGCPTTPHTDALTAIRYHESMRVRVRSIRAEARIDQRDRSGRIRGTVMMFVERPNHVRFDAMTQFGPAAILTSNGRDFALTDLRENTYLEGPTCPRSIARLVGIPLSGEDVSRVLLGGTPVIEATERQVECTGDGAYRITLSGGRDHRRQVIELAVREQDLRAPPEEQRLRLVKSEVFDARGRTQWRATWDDHRVLPLGEMGVAMPFEVRFEDPSRGVDTLMRFQSIDLNVDVPPDAFVQHPRGGITVEHVSCD